LVPSLLPKGSTKCNAVLLEAMMQIDAYIGGGWSKYDDDQEFIFPRCQDEDSNGDPQVPRPISVATRIIADAILKRRQTGVLPHELQSESNLGHSYSRKNQGTPEFGFEHFPPEAIALLQDFKQFGGTLALDDPDLVEC